MFFFVWEEGMHWDRGGLEYIYNSIYALGAVTIVEEFITVRCLM